MNEKTRRLIVIGIAGILILLGLLGAVFKIKIKMNILNQISTILMLIAALVLFSGRRPGRGTNQDPSGKSTTTENQAPAADDTENKP